jgi:hypothetical protein
MSAVNGAARGSPWLSGAQLLAKTARVAGRYTSLSATLAPERKHRAVHDPGKIAPDLAMMLAAGGTADPARARGGMRGALASAGDVTGTARRRRNGRQPAGGTIRM